jgi:peroxiredoxin
LIILWGCSTNPQSPEPNAVLHRSTSATSPTETQRDVAVPELPPAAAPVEIASPEQPDAVAQQVEIVPQQATTQAPPESTLAAVPTPAEPPPIAKNEPVGAHQRTVFYRADATQPAVIPPVALSKGEESLCRVKVGDTMPAIELDQLGGERKRLTDLAGKTATVVVFWKSDRRMAHQELADLGPDVLEPFGEAGVAVVGIAVDESAESAQEALKLRGANFSNLLDVDGSAFAQVGSQKLPRTYLVDPQGKILWFDIEYSLATRRELHQALRALVENK